jgi:membrane-associated phospholipid phosphatase
MRTRLASLLPRAAGALFTLSAAALGQDSTPSPGAALDTSVARSATPGNILASVSSFSSAPSKTFFTHHDLELTALALAGAAVVSSFDKRLAHYSQTASVQGSTSRQRVAKKLTKINWASLTVVSLAGYGLGRLTRSPTVAEVSLHTAEAVVLTTLISGAIRAPLGRARPLVDINDPYHFRFGKGFTQLNNRSFPSLHSSTAFAAAAAISGEIHARNPSTNAFVSPLLYTAAAIPGLTRIYLNQHWASDIVAGGFIGVLIGSRVVSYAHSHDRWKLDRFLLGTSDASIGHRGTMLSVTLEY